LNSKLTNLFAEYVLIPVIFALPACESSKPEHPDPGLADPGLTGEIKRELGAATWIPADACYFSTNLRLGEVWNKVRNSRAIKKLLSLPAVQEGLGQLRRTPLYQQVLREQNASSLPGTSLAIAREAISQEIFIYGDARCISILNAFSSLYWEMFIEGFKAGFQSPRRGAGPEMNRKLISTILHLEKDLRVPPVVLGFRVSSSGSIQEKLTRLMNMIRPQIPFPIEELEISGGRYSIIRLAGTMVPPPVRHGFLGNLARDGIPEELVRRLNEFIDSLSLVFSIGLRGDYLLVGIGPDTEHLRKLGQAPSLAGSESFKPVRQHFKPGVISLAYIDEKLTSSGKLPVDSALAALDGLLAVVPPGKLPENFPGRLRTDARAFLDDMNRYLPEPAPWISISFLNDGIESYSFSAFNSASLDASKPLEFNSGGGDALAAVATRSPSSREPYERLAHWLTVAYGYFEEFIVPTIPKRSRGEFERFRSVFIPAIKELHVATRDLLIPAVDGCQSLLQVDGGGRLGGIPNSGISFASPLHYPRLAFMTELNDPEKLKEAFSRYRETVNRFIEKAAETELGLEPFRIPEPESRPFSGGTLYTYPLPFDLGSDFEPHALVTEKHLILSLSPDHSRSLVKSPIKPANRVIDFALPAGMVYHLNLKRLIDLIATDAEAIVKHLASRGEIPGQLQKIMESHFPVARDVFGCIRSFSGRIYEEEGIQVHHSWFHIEDLPDA